MATTIPEKEQRPSLENLRASLQDRGEEPAKVEKSERESKLDALRAALRDRANNREQQVPVNPALAPNEVNITPRLHPEFTSEDILALHSGKPLPTKLRPGQMYLWKVLEEYDVSGRGNIPLDEIRRIIHCFDLVSDQVLTLVADRLLLEKQQILAGRRYKTFMWPSVGYLAQKCIAANKIINELEKLIQSRKPPKPPIRRVVL